MVKVVSKAHTDVHINRILFLPYDSSRLISCGRENVRFWRLKNETLRSCAVNLSPYIQALNTPINSWESQSFPTTTTTTTADKVFLEFTDLAMNARLESSNDNLVYACTKSSQIFVFNTARMDIENVRVLEPVIEKNVNKGILITKNEVKKETLKLNSLTVSDSFCVTGSEDGFVRVWPLDFSQVSVEAEHESSIGAVRCSPDCFKIATSTSSGNLGNNKKIKL
jgi:WD40 repeat protein